jgi:hypothetical protein
MQPSIVNLLILVQIPEGAINLTWYHREGSRVFRDMRFLIVPHSHADLVIGATSALKYDIVTKQDLMVAKVGQYQGLMTIGNKTKGKLPNPQKGNAAFKPNMFPDEEWKELHRAFNLRNEELKNIRTRQAQARVDKKSKEELEQIDRDYRECKAKYDVDEKRFAICHAERKNTSKELLDEIKEDLDKLVKKTKPEVEDFEAAVDSET